MPPGLLRSLRADPHHAAERLVLFAAERLAEPSWSFAERERRRRPEASPAELSAPVISDTVRVARIDGAVSGTPFFLALVPAYVAVLWEQVRMAMRIAALHGRDPREPGFAAELLWLRGVHPTRKEAEAAIERARGAPLPQHAEGRRLRRWYDLGRRVLVLAGFLSPPDPDAGPRPRWRMVLGVAVGTALWAVTWIFPLTFMLAMAFSCVSSTNLLADRSLEEYGTAEESRRARKRDPSVSRRTRLLRGAAIALSLGLPLAALALATRQRQTGVNWYSVLGVLAGLALVLALAGARARQDRRAAAA
jgi:hypothetical protein